MNYQKALEWITSQKGWIDPYEFSEENQDIYEELLKKANPTEMFKEKIGNIIHLHCPNCKRVVTHETEGGRRYITKHNYCHKCGQAFKWEE